MHYPQSLPAPNAQRTSFHDQLLKLCRTWSAPLQKNVTRTNSHDLGFITRALRMDWELTGSMDSLQGYLTAAMSLASRYDERIGAIRSWDQAVSKRYSITDKQTNFIIIIDSMCSEFSGYVNNCIRRMLIRVRYGFIVLCRSLYIKPNAD